MFTAVNAREAIILARFFSTYGNDDALILRRAINSVEGAMQIAAGQGNTVAELSVSALNLPASIGNDINLVEHILNTLAAVMSNRGFGVVVQSDMREVTTIMMSIPAL